MGNSGRVTCTVLWIGSVIIPSRRFRRRHVAPRRLPRNERTRTASFASRGAARSIARPRRTAPAPSPSRLSLQRSSARRKAASRPRSDLELKGGLFLRGTTGARVEEFESGASSILGRRIEWRQTVEGDRRSREATSLPWEGEEEEEHIRRLRLRVSRDRRTNQVFPVFRHLSDTFLTHFIN